MKESLRAYCLRTEKEALLNEWCDERNGDWTPDSLTCSSGKMVWWKCERGHLWRSAVYSRVKQGSGCPYCANHLIWQGYNDLASQRPELAQQWYQPLNGNKTPKTMLISSHYKAWWLCPDGHVWRTEVSVRVRGHNCPGCVGQGKRVAFSITPDEDGVIKIPEGIKGDGTMNMDSARRVLDQLDEVVYISDLNTYEMLYLNRYGVLRFGEFVPGTKCYEHLQGKNAPCEFCTNGILPHCPGQRHTWVRQHPSVGDVLLHDSIIDYDGRPCRMEVAISVNRYVEEVNAAKKDLDAERKLVKCIEGLVLATDFDAAVNSMLGTIIEHYDADRAYIFEFDWDRNVTSNTFEICRDGVTPEKENLQNVPIAVVALWVDIFRSQNKKINIIEDVDALKDDPARRIEYDCLHPQGIKSLITVPVFVGGELHGFLGVDNPHSHVDAPEMLTQVTYIAANELHKRTLTDELTVKSYLDPLTGLRNRLAYDEVLDHLLGREVPTGVGFLDLNGLKWINDNLGHDMGNKALRRVCEIVLRHIPREHLYRISGDEFVIIWPNVEYQTFADAAETLEVTLAAEQDIASFGFVWGAEEDVGVAVRKAEQAMQAQKNKFYAANTDLKGQRPGYLDLLLQEFRDSTFIPYLQPLYSIQYDCVYGAEVLVRKIDPKGNIHPPVEFIKIMEKEHMISMVDLEMLRQSCQLIQKWKDQWPHLVLNVNFSRNTLVEPDYLSQVDKILADTGANPKQLIFEITESSQGIQLESLSSLLDELKKRGITIAIDDLGTEAACLEMLYLPQISVAKIDRSLICKAEHSRREQTVIRHLIDLCHDLNMRCVAEGIETDSQIELLKRLGCDRLQGYKIGKPMPADEFFANFNPQAVREMKTTK